MEKLLWLVSLLPLFAFGQFNGDGTFKATYCEGGNYCAQFHRIDSINTSGSGSWVDVKFDTLVGDESTKFYTFNSDSTGFIMGFTGITRVQGCGHWIWNGGDNTAAKTYIRTTIAGAEARCLEMNDSRAKKAADDAVMVFAGTIYHTTGQEVKIQYQVSDDDMDFQGSAVFTNPVSFSVNFERISN